jgi:TPR repeat protein
MNSHRAPDQSITAVGLAAYFRLRARADDVFAQFVYGVCLDNGYGAPINFALAATYYKLAAEHNYAPAQYFYAERLGAGKIIARNPFEAIIYYKRAADRNYAEAQFIFGCVLYQGIAIERNLSEAARYFRLAADQNFAPSQFNYGQCLYRGEGVAINLSEAARYFKLAADQNHAEGQLNYGHCLSRGEGVEVDFHEASRYFKLAADQNDAEGQFNYGHCLYRGKGVEVDFHEASRYFKLAADQNHAGGQLNYGNCLSRGEGVDIDFHEAARYFKLAADQGLPSAQTLYGFALEFGVGVGVDIADAVLYYERAAKGGDTHGANNFGLCLEFGKGIKMNFPRAVKYYKLAADQGHLGAQNNFGFCLQHGLGVQVDEKQAAVYYKMSADQAHGIGAFHYALCLQYGIGVEANVEEAVKYYELASDQGRIFPMRDLFRCRRAQNRATFSRDQFPELRIGEFTVFDAYDSIRSFTSPQMIADLMVQPLWTSSCPVIGTGGCARVNLRADPRTGTKLAIKVLLPYPVIDKQAFMMEIEALHKLNHPCVVRIVSYSFPTESKFAEIHTEYAENGSLASVLKRIQSGFGPSFWTPTGIGIIICGIVLGMRYVHANKYIHRDLKPANIMINGKGQALIGDFGTSCLASEDSQEIGGGGSVHYAAPEMYQDEIAYTTKVDIFSFGLVLFEILFGSAVFAKSPEAARVILRVRAGDMPPIPDRCGEPMQNLIRRCWSMNPEARPSFNEILDEFRDSNFSLFPGADSEELAGYVYDIEMWETVNSQRQPPRH